MGNGRSRTVLGEDRLDAARLGKRGRRTSAQSNSQTARSYERRCTRVDEAIPGVGLNGTRTRRIESALAPLTTGRSVVEGRLVQALIGRLKEKCETWREGDLAPKRIRYATCCSMAGIQDCASVSTRC